MTNDKLAKPQTFGFLSASAEDAAQMKQLVAEAAEDEITQFDLPEVKVPAGGATSWEVPTLAGEETIKQLKCVVLCAQKVRQYYAGEFTGENAPPDCASADGVEGLGTPGGECATCPLAQWGSGTNGGQACSERRHMLLLRENSALPVFLNLPPSSLKQFKRYRTLLLGAQTPLHGVITDLGLAKAKNATGIEYSQVTFASAGPLEAEAVRRGGELREMYRALLATRVEMPGTPDPADAAVNVDDYVDGAVVEG